MTDQNATHVCPRRAETGRGPVGAGGPVTDGWFDDNTCSYCGSFNPDEFMRRLEAGDVELEPTDKSYKVYVRNAGGEGFKHTYRDCRDAQCSGPDTCTHWVTTRDRERTKFYFQHLSIDQRKRFVDLMNAGSLKLAYPGRFYVMPFFCTRAGAAS